MNSDDRIEALLARAALRAARGPAPLMAPLVEAWRRMFEKNPAEALGIADRTLVQIALCQRPRAERWNEDASEIAAEFAIEPARLVSFLKAAESAELLASAHLADTGQAGRLLAARDRDEEE
jgi:hypothetical protein